MFDPKQRAVSLFEEFKNFALKGNLIDLAVGVIIGAAFGKIVSSLVEDILMPLINLFLPGTGSFEDRGILIGDKFIPTGKFLAAVVNFLVVALAVFLFIVKFLGWIVRAKKKEEAAPATSPSPTKDQELLMEIRDLLKKQAG